LVTSDQVLVTANKKTAAFSLFEVSPTEGYVPLEVTISGQLYCVETGSPLEGKTIDYYRNETYIGSTTTNPWGLFALIYTIEEAGDHTFYVEFEGDAEYEGCAETW